MICSQCGKPIEDDDIFCGWCGSKVVMPVEEPDIDSEPVEDDQIESTTESIESTDLADLADGASQADDLILMEAEAKLDRVKLDGLTEDGEDSVKIIDDFFRTSDDKRRIQEELNKECDEARKFYAIGFEDDLLNDAEAEMRPGGNWDLNDPMAVSTAAAAVVAAADAIAKVFAAKGKTIPGINVSEGETNAEPEIIVEPKGVAEPVVAVEPKTVDEPEVVIEPEIVGEPEVIAEPVVAPTEQIVVEQKEAPVEQTTVESETENTEQQAVSPDDLKAQIDELSAWLNSLDTNLSTPANTAKNANISNTDNESRKAETLDSVLTDIPEDIPEDIPTAAAIERDIEALENDAKAFEKDIEVLKEEIEKDSGESASIETEKPEVVDEEYDEVEEEEEKTGASGIIKTILLVILTIVLLLAAIGSVLITFGRNTQVGEYLYNLVTGNNQVVEEAPETPTTN